MRAVGERIVPIRDFCAVGMNVELACFRAIRVRIARPGDMGVAVSGRGDAGRLG